MPDFSVPLIDDHWCVKSGTPPPAEALVGPLDGSVRANGAWTCRLASESLRSVKSAYDEHEEGAALIAMSAVADMRDDGNG